jgi:AcrR family transcriptional regulator
LTDNPPLLPGELAKPDEALRRPRRVSEIVAAARRLLDGEGPDALTMRRIAEELGIQAPSLYKHFSGKAAVELALIEDAMLEVGEASHDAVRRARPDKRIEALLATYRRHAAAHPHLYRLATAGPLAREAMAPGLEEWAGNPWYVVTADPSLAQALWSFAHGMVVLEIDGRFPPGSDLDATWKAGADAFARAVTPGSSRPRRDRVRPRSRSVR